MSKTKPSKPAPNERRAIATQLAPARKRSLNKSATTTAPKTTTTRKPGKIDKIIVMLRRPNGASIGELSKATAWQAHSVRGAISGTIRKKQGLNVTSEKTGAVRLYRIVNKAAG